jgi:hypothetical protein
LAFSTDFPAQYGAETQDGRFERHTANNMANQGQVKSPNGMLESQLSLFFVLKSQGFHDLIYSFDL